MDGGEWATGLADGDDIGRARRRRVERPPEELRVIVIISNCGSVSENQIRNIQREFPWIVVEQVRDVKEVCKAFSHPVSLLLVEIGLMKAVVETSSEIGLSHPQALAAVIERPGQDLATPLLELIGCPIVCGVVPMCLGIDIWLSVMRLMLSGGEYFPPRLILNRRRNRHDQSPRSGDRAPARPARNDITALTARELEILELVSHGLQNKVIAAKIQLSEHTVKIHLHNIITRLEVRNRTEAAARFRTWQETRLVEIPAIASNGESFRQPTLPRRGSRASPHGV